MKFTTSICHFKLLEVFLILCSFQFSPLYILMSNLTHNANPDDISYLCRFLHYNGHLSYSPLQAIFTTLSLFTKKICDLPCA